MTSWAAARVYSHSGEGCDASTDQSRAPGRDRLGGRFAPGPPDQNASHTSHVRAAGLVGTGVITALLLVEPSVGRLKIAMGQVLSTSLGLASAHLTIVVAQLVFMPLVGSGVFSRGDVLLLAGSLIGHLVYGGVTGWIYGGARVAV